MIYVNPTEEKILAALKKSKHGLSEFLIRKETGVSKSSVTVYLRELHSEGVVRRAPTGPGYMLAEELVDDEDADVEASVGDGYLPPDDRDLADIGGDDVEDLDRIIAAT